MIKFSFNKIINSFHSNDLKSRCVRGSTVLGAATIFSKACGLGSKIVLTRILLPREMGVAVILITITTFFEAISEVGIKQSVIQNKRGSEDEYLNIAWWFQAIRALVLYGLAFLVVPTLTRIYFASKEDILLLYDWSTLKNMLYVLFSGILFNGFVSPRSHLLEKEIRFFKVAIIKEGGFLIGTIITIVLILMMKNIWGMVIGFVCINAMKCLLSYIVSPYIPKLSFHREHLSTLFRFAQGAFGLPVLTYLIFNIDILLLGRYSSADLVGMYGMAMVLARVPFELYSKILNPLLLPVFSLKQDDYDSVRRIVYRISRYINMGQIPIISVISLFGSHILTLFYVEEYAAVKIAFFLQAISILPFIHANIFANILFSMGKPEKHRAWCIIVASTMALVGFPMIPLFSDIGAAGTLVISHFLGFTIQIVVISRQIKMSIMTYLSTFVPGCLIAFCLVFIYLIINMIN